MTERTFALIKSGALHRLQAAQIMGMLDDAGLTVRQSRVIYSPDPLLLHDLYAEHVGKPFYDGLIASVSDGIFVMVLEGDDVVQRWRTAMGPTDPVTARETAPDSIRARFGLELPDNAVHGSDSRVSAEWEIAIFFGSD